MTETMGLTVLRSRGRRLAKTIAADGSVRNYDDAKTFDLAERTFADLADLAGLLTELSRQPDRCIVRGGIADPDRTRSVRRLLHAGGGDPPTLIDAPRAWLALDVDDAPRPKYADPASVFETAMVVLAMLPTGFHGAGCVAQGTASFGLKPGARLRLWFITDRPLTGAEAGRWLTKLRKGAPWIDPASARPAQIIYTAAPVFEKPEMDTVQNRIDYLAGGALRVPAAAELKPPPMPTMPARPLPDAADTRARRYASAALIAAGARIAASGIGTRHAKILKEARSLSRFREAGLLSETEISAMLHAAAALAGKSDPAEIDAAIAWGAAHASPAALPGGITA